MGTDRKRLASSGDWRGRRLSGVAQYRIFLIFGIPYFSACADNSVIMPGMATSTREDHPMTGHRIANPSSTLPCDQSDDCLLVEWDGGWDTADDLEAAHALAKRHHLGNDYTVTVNEVDGEVVYEGPVPPPHDCSEHAVPYESDGALGHGWECGVCGAFLQAG